MVGSLYVCSPSISLFVRPSAKICLPIKMMSRAYKQTSYGMLLSCLRSFSFVQAEQLTPLMQVKFIFKDMGDCASRIMVFTGDLRSGLSSKPPFSDGTRIFFFPVMAKHFRR